jgi:uncharacterized membrane protein HdeD (DUF308 family)
MKKYLHNWQTTIAGIATIILGIINFKNNPTESCTAITGGIGLILAKDGNGNIQ